MYPERRHEVSLWHCGHTGGWLHMPLVRSFRVTLFLAVFLASQGAMAAHAAETDPKAACRAEEVIKSIAGTPPDKLDFLGERLKDGSFRCEAYFTYNVYNEVWSRLNDLSKTLKYVEAICLINGLQKLPKIGALQIEYVMTTAGQFRIKAVSDGLPVAPKKLSQRLQSDIQRLEKVRDADDDAIIREFVRKKCPEADYPPEIEQ